MRKIGVPAGDDERARAAAKYPLDKSDAPEAYARSGYYTDDEMFPGGTRATANSMWLGSTAALEQLGVASGDEVVLDELALAMQGRHVETGEQVRPPSVIRVVARDERGHAVRDEHKRLVKEPAMGINSFDLTFSAPKSVSVLWSQASAAQRTRIEHAVMVAANAAIEHMLQTKKVVCRRLEDGTKVTECGRGFAAAATLHVTARRAKGDAVPWPQLHVHGVVVGVERSDGRLVALGNSEAIYKHDAPLEGGAVGRAVLAHELMQLGYRIESDTGRNHRFFEVAGVPAALIDRMSGRTRDVMRAQRERELQKGERLSGEELAALAMETRETKDHDLSAEEVGAYWDAQAEECEFGLDKAAALETGEPTMAEMPVREDDARGAMLARLREHGPMVSHGQMIAIAYEVAAGRLSREEMHGLLEAMERSGELIALEDGLVTSRQIRAMEERVMRVATNAATTPSPALSPHAIETGLARANAALEGKGTLKGEQEDAFRRLTDRQGWSTLTGRAGTGKGPVLHAVAEAHRAGGWQVIACAVDGTTAQRLGQQLHPDAGGAAADSATVTHCTIDQLLYRVKKGEIALDDRTLIVIDEASKVGLGLWGQLTRLRAPERAFRVLAVGHEGQLGAIELPGMFGLMLSRTAIPKATLERIRRHLDPANLEKDHPWLGTYQIAIDDGRPEDALKELRSADAITMRATRADAMEAMVSSWDEVRDPTRPMESILVVHGPNRDVDQANALAQERRYEKHEIGGPSVHALDCSYRIYEGDAVIVRETSYTPQAASANSADDREAEGRRVENGAMGMVVGVDAQRNLVRVQLREPGQRPRVVEIDQAALRARRARGEKTAVLRLAYAFHPFPLQGATVEHVHELGGHWSQGREASYVAGSRAKLSLRVFVDRESLGLDGDDDARLERYAKTRLSRSQNRAASLTKKRSWAQINRELPRSRRVRPFAEKASEGERPGGRWARGAIRKIGREQITVPNPLEPFRESIGRYRSAWIEQRARQLGAEMTSWHLERLRVERAASHQAWELLDHGGALETLRVQRERRLGEDRGREAARQANELQQRARSAKGLGRGERRELSDAAERQRKLMEEERLHVAKLAEQERRLHVDGRHLDDWMTDERERAAMWVAAQREILTREELLVASEVERAVAAPSPELRELLGAPPGRSSAQRGEWEALVRTIERQRLIADRDSEPALDLTDGPEEITKRMVQLRAHRGLEPLEGADLPREITGAVALGAG